MIGFVFIAAGVLWWITSSRRNPWRRCWWCQGRGRRYGWIAVNSWHPCTCCDGTGRHLRVGARLFGIHERRRRGRFR
jgi:hypothetical protein